MEVITKMEKNRENQESDDKMVKKKSSFQKAIMAIFGVMIAYTSQYTPDPVVKTATLFFGMFIVLYAVIK